MAWALGVFGTACVGIVSRGIVCCVLTTQIVMHHLAGLRRFMGFYGGIGWLIALCCI